MGQHGLPRNWQSLDERELERLYAAQDVVADDGMLPAGQK
jgi:hypothetical protein